MTGHPAVTVAEWPRNSREVLRVRLDSYNSRAVFDLRVWYREGDDLKPGRQGLTISVRHLPDIADGVAAALAHARAAGLLDDPAV